MNNLWRPSASLETLKARASLLSAIRAFFAERHVLEVDTPILSRHATVDRHIESFAAAGQWLHTSPEFAMKRLLAAGSGSIYQLCHVFRAGDVGQLHNPEFLMLEWYRVGWDATRLMDEIEDLLRALGVPMGAPVARLTYRQAFEQVAQIDPFTATIAQLRGGLASHGVTAPGHVTPDEATDRDFWLDLWMGAIVGPKLGLATPCFVHDFPASQAALARVRDGNPPVAERFELFWRGLELANGFHELTDAAEQKRRFESDRDWRKQHDRSVPPYDANLIAALESGLPPCAGVALGVDRLLMLLLGLPDVASVMPFDSARA